MTADERVAQLTRRIVDALAVIEPLVKPRPQRPSKAEQAIIDAVEILRRIE